LPEIHINYCSVKPASVATDLKLVRASFSDVVSGVVLAGVALSNVVSLLVSVVGELLSLHALKPKAIRQKIETLVNEISDS